MRTIAAIMMIGLLVSCGQTSEQTERDEDGKTLTPEMMRENIAELEKDLVKGKRVSQLNTNKAKRLIQQYQMYINSNPSDSTSASYLHKAADLSVGVGNFDASIRFIDKLIEDHQDFEKLPEIMLFKGFVYEAHLDNHANAVKAYEALRDRFPNHKLANDAKAAIENLTLTEEELLQKFEQMNATPES